MADNLVNNVYGIWAKTSPYKCLLHHMIDAGMMGKVLLQDSILRPVRKRLEELLQNDNIINTISCIIALHDIGKCHPYFQGQQPAFEYIRQLSSGGKLSIKQQFSYRHEVGSKCIIENIFRTKQNVPLKISRLLGTVLRLHHQKGACDVSNCRVPQNMDRQFWEAQQNELFLEVCSVFDPDFGIMRNCINQDAAAVLIWGCTVLSDWLASGQSSFYDLNESLPIDQYAHESFIAAESTHHNAGLNTGKFIAARGFCDIWKDFLPSGLRPLQTACSELAKMWKLKNDFPGFVILEAPMGEGKTEAGLFLAVHLMNAFHKTGFYVALPTAATSNSMHERTQKWLLGHDIPGAKLMHAQAWLYEGETGFSGEMEDTKEAVAWLAPLRRGMLSQYAVGTVDQVMMAVMRIKYGVLRLAGAASKVIVIDEVHAYDAYMLAIIERLLNWCAVLSIPVIMLSATLPIERRNRLLNAYAGDKAVSTSQCYPLITSVETNGSVVETTVNGSFMNQEIDLEVSDFLGNWEEVAGIALNRVSQGGCLCVLVNTVGEAQCLYKIMLDQKSEDVELYLFHARFPAEKRQEIEKKCVGVFGKDGTRPKKAVLVATQVVEQSLDLDFDAMITSLAPIDLVLQRIGRVHRHAGRVRPENLRTPKITVLAPAGTLKQTPTAMVYSAWILKQTLRTLKRIDCIKLPQDIRPLVEEVYSSQPQTDDSDFKEWVELAFNKELLHENAQSVLYPPPSPKHFFAAENEGFFYDEESDDLYYRGARTRMGEDTVRIALIPNELAQKADDPDIKTAREILAQTLGIRSSKLKNRRPHPDYLPEKAGEGLLRGILLLPSDGQKYAFKKDNKTLELIIDDVLGLIIKEV